MPTRSAAPAEVPGPCPDLACRTRPAAYPAAPTGVPDDTLDLAAAHRHQALQERSMRQLEGELSRQRWTSRPVLHLHATSYCYAGDADPSAPGGMTVIYRDLIASQARTSQVITDVTAAFAQGRNCLVLTTRIRCTSQHPGGRVPVWDTEFGGPVRS